MPCASTDRPDAGSRRSTRDSLRTGRAYSRDLRSVSVSTPGFAHTRLAPPADGVDSGALDAGTARRRAHSCARRRVRHRRRSIRPQPPLPQRRNRRRRFQRPRACVGARVPSSASGIGATSGSSWPTFLRLDSIGSRAATFQSRLVPRCRELCAAGRPSPPERGGLPGGRRCPRPRGQRCGACQRRCAGGTSTVRVRCRTIHRRPGCAGGAGAVRRAARPHPPFRPHCLAAGGLRRVGYLRRAESESAAAGVGPDRAGGRPPPSEQLVGAPDAAARRGTRGM